MSSQFYGDESTVPKVGEVINNYSLEKILDNTKNSIVFLAKNIKDNEKVAIKFIKYRKAAISRVDAEIELMSNCKCPFIIQAREIFDYLPYKCLVMPLAMSDMNNILHCAENHRLDEDLVKEVIRSALLALKYLHDNQICHRDIKPDNLLYLGEEEEEAVQLTDLGFATKVESNQLCNEYVGTLNYAAPEIISGKPYDKSIDIWSLGVSMYTLLSGSNPFPSNPESTLRRCIQNGAYLFPASKWKGISREAKDLISHMIKVDPLERYTVNQCLDHKWFSSIPHSKSWHNLNLNPNTYC